jgi:hypothetical protein
MRVAVHQIMLQNKFPVILKTFINWLNCLIRVVGLPVHPTNAAEIASSSFIAYFQFHGKKFLSYYILS